MYVMARLNERGGDRKTALAVRAARSTEEAHALIRDSLPPVVAAALTEDALQRIRAQVDAIEDISPAPRVTRDDMRGALGVFLIVAASTFPVILPFIFMSDLQLAMRVSNGIAVAMLAFIGHAYGRASGFSPWWTAGIMVLLGLILVAITIALGG